MLIHSQVEARVSATVVQSAEAKVLAAQAEATTAQAETLVQARALDQQADIVKQDAYNF